MFPIDRGTLILSLDILVSTEEMGAVTVNSAIIVFKRISVICNVLQMSCDASWQCFLRTVEDAAGKQFCRNAPFPKLVFLFQISNRMAFSNELPSEQHFFCGHMQSQVYLSSEAKLFGSEKEEQMLFAGLTS